MRLSKNKPIHVALYGMDHRTCKALSMYLIGPCKGIAIVVDQPESEVDILDADFIKAKEILSERKAQGVTRPLIILSIEPLDIEGTIFVKKPIQTIELVTVFKTLQSTLSGKTSKKPSGQQVSQTQTEKAINSDKTSSTEIKQTPDTSDDNSVYSRNKKHISQTGEKRKSHKHRTAMDITESNYANQIGSIEGLNFNNREQMLAASHNPDEYYLGYLKSAIIKAKKDRKERLLYSNWKPLMIFPETNDIWVDSNDIQLRAFANLPLKIIEEHDRLTLTTPIDPINIQLTNDKDCFVDVNSFIWKLAIWTSKGRYPKALNVNQPIYLIHWPNFTRLLITPHAIRIAALLMSGPRSPINISDALKIQPHFVFLFISAAHAIGLVGQAVRQVDNIIEPSDVKKPKTKKGLLSRILSKLRS